MIWRCIVEVEIPPDEGGDINEQTVRNVLESRSYPGFWVRAKFLEAFASVRDAEEWDRHELPLGHIFQPSPVAVWGDGCFLCKQEESAHVRENFPKAK